MAKYKRTLEPGLVFRSISGQKYEIEALTDNYFRTPGVKGVRARNVDTGQLFIFTQDEVEEWVNPE